MKISRIGFIGQGFIGKNLADNIEDNGFDVVRYSLDDEYIKNRGSIAECDVVFIAVPTPTYEMKFDETAILDALSITAPNQVVVIKSTVPWKYVYRYQLMYNDRQIVLCPEFLDADTAKHDTDNPTHVVIGFDKITEENKKVANTLFSIMPRVKDKTHEVVCTYKEASLIKYGHNCFFYTKNIFFNTLYDLCQAVNADFDSVINGILGDPRITATHTNPIHKNGRGAGGYCLVKDYAQFTNMLHEFVGGLQEEIALVTMERNVELLKESGKDQKIREEVHGV
jgi:UDPglucose 6-dehydrogenase